MGRRHKADCRSGRDDGEASEENIDFLFSIIERNHTIPVVLTDDEGNILLHRNFDLPEPVDSLSPISYFAGKRGVSAG